MNLAMQPSEDITARTLSSEVKTNGPSIGKSAICKSYKTDRLVDMSRLWPGWGRVRNGSKMSRHREIQTTVRTKAPFTKTPFSRSRSLKSMELWPRRANTLIQGVKAEKNKKQSDVAHCDQQMARPLPF